MIKKNPTGPFASALADLAAWFGRQRRILPWRENPDAYRVWISEIMLQQTQVVTVIPYFEKFMKRFPTLESLARASEDDVLLHWAGLGYYSRARNIHRGAQQLLETGFPGTREKWLEVPGVGPYTAGAILSISMGRPEAILDGNVERVISRLRRTGRDKKRLWRLSRIFVERAHAAGISPSVTNQALMELGATICTPKAPKCLLCPVVSLCRAHRMGEEEAFPPKKKPKEWIDVREELHCYIDSSGRVLLRKRARGEWRAGLWDLPAHPIGELEGRGAFGEVETRHIVTRHRITRKTRVWGALSQASHWKAAEADGFSENWRWVSIDSSGSESSVAMGSALRKTLKQIHETFPEAWPDS